MFFRNVRILGQYERPAADPNYRDIPDTGGQPVVPDTNFVTNYSANLSSGGGIVVTVGGDQYEISSKFSYPNGTLNRLNPSSPAQGEWSVVVDGNSVTATGQNYRLDRQISLQDEYIEVLDTVTNLTGGVIGIRIGHEINIAKDDLEKSYMTGMRVPKKEGIAGQNPNTGGNPTVFVAKPSSGIGLLPRDNVFRAHVSLEMADGAYGIYDNYFALDVNSAYTMKWQIFPTEAGDYFEFINAARREMDVNYEIKGNVVIAHGHEGNMSGISDQDIINLVQRNNAKYVIFSTIHRLDENGDRVDTGTIADSAHGSGFTADDFGYWNRYWMQQVIARYRSLVPNVILMPYIDPWLTSEPNALTNYPDSYAKNSDGSPQTYTSDELKVMYPTGSNSYGAELENFFDWTFDNADSFYLDESSMSENIDSGSFSYRTDTWDGHTAIMSDLFYQFQRKAISSSLYTLDYRIAQYNKAKQVGQDVWVNFAPTTQDETAAKIYHFIESRSNNNVVFGHLSTPVALGNDDWERTESDIGAGVRYKVWYGGLYVPYTIKYQTDGNILQDLYPFTPNELHLGYVIGGNKIVTITSGEFGFGGNLTLTVKLYDAGGFYLPARTGTVRYDASLDSTLMDVQLQEGELAIIFKAD